MNLDDYDLECTCDVGMGPARSDCPACSNRYGDDQPPVANTQRALVRYPVMHARVRAKLSTLKARSFSHRLNART